MCIVSIDNDKLLIGASITKGEVIIIMGHICIKK